MLGYAQQTRAEHADLVRRLRGGVDGERARRPARVVDDQSPAFHGRRRVPMLVDRLCDHVGRGGEHIVECRELRTGHLAHQVGAVALVHECVGLVSLGVVDNRRERLIVDLNQLRSVLGHVAALGHDEHDGVADEADLSLGQRRPGGLRAPGPERRVPLLLGVSVEVGGGEDEANDPGHGAGGRGVDASHVAAEMAAHEAGVQHPGQGDVVDEGTPARQQPGVLDAVDPRARVPPGAGRRLGRHRRSLRSTAGGDESPVTRAMRPNRRRRG